ncbi:MAG: hypothetical protein HY315_09490 [Acidobacteria bacterium]|nr:hypothetical protein [Acidobacteriota bacterium]
MILVDANVLIYAYSPTSREHGMARAWLAEALSRPQPVRVARTSVLAFMRILTRSRIFRRPLSIQETIRIVDSWFEQPAVDWLQPPSAFRLVAMSEPRASASGGGKGTRLLHGNHWHPVRLYALVETKHDR